MFEDKETRDKKITVRFTKSELIAMQQYIKTNNIKTIPGLIRVAVKDKLEK